MDSIQRQTLGNWEHIIVDDGSNDGTYEEVVRRSGADSRVRFLPRISKKTGANVCRNIGIRESRSELVVFLDSDDLLRPECLQRRVEIMQRDPDLDFSVFRAGVFVESVGDLKRLYHDQDPGDDLLRFLAHECVWEIAGPIWRRSFLNRIGCFDETLLSMQDLELHVRAISARAKYLCFSDIDHDIRWQEDVTKTSVRHYRDPDYIEAVEKVQQKLLDNVTNGGLLTWSRQRVLLGLSFEAAECWIRSKRLGRAARAWYRGCVLQKAHKSLWIVGVLMLLAGRLGRGPNGFCLRLVNKWKGWVRFRQEPLLLKSTKARPLEVRPPHVSSSLSCE